MTKITFVLIVLQLAFFVGYSEVILGAPIAQPTTITPDLKALLNAGLEQVHNLGGSYEIQNPTEVIVMQYSTQVVSGTLSKLLVEVRSDSGSKLVSADIWDEPWTGRVHQLKKACSYANNVGNFYPTQCGSVEDCVALLMKNGNCRDI